jgi:alkanesulfonate monooxygenase SsuD/methylene tetrahydromethanopterin reductase-like flavin-dependent oxidoreductase (luciferase family)
MADGFLTSAAWGAGNVLTYRKVREALAGHERADADFPYVASGVVYVREDSERARNEVAPAIAYQHSRYAEWGTDRDEPKPEPVRPEDLSWEGYFVGNPEEVAEA